MKEPISDFTLKASIRRIVHDTYSRHMAEPAAVYHDIVISLVWNWIYTPEVLNQTVNTDELVELLRKEYGYDAVEDKGVVDGYQRYEILFSNVRFHIVKLPMSYRIGAALPVTNVVYVSCWNPQETLCFMRAFNELIPAVHDYIDQNLSAAAKESMICDVTAASGKGIIDQLIAEEGLEIPHIDRICGTANWRVKVYFADSSEKINCPLDYLRSRFLRRFGKRKTK